MNNPGNLNLGDEIKDIVQTALNNKDFKKLNNNIKNVVNSALDEVRTSVNVKQGNMNNKMTFSNQKQIEKNKTMKMTGKGSKLAIPMGQVSGILLTVFGIIGSIGFGIAVFALIALGFTIGSKGLFHTIAFGLSPLFVLSLALSSKGTSNIKRLKRFQRYIAQMNGQTYCLINDLSYATGWSNKAVEKDLRKMIQIGMFPQGHIDDEKKYFMLNNEIYGEYIKLKKSVAMKELEKSKEMENKIIDEKSNQKGNKNDNLKPEIRKAIDEGRRFVLDIKEANVAIPGEEVSIKLDRLEEVTGKIFDYVEFHPEKFTEIKKFTEYFLPTTLKLLDGYRKLDDQSIQGENISSAKREIEETMDTINLAFENLLDDLFQDVTMDILTDISVLETMFAQEGLTNNNMRKNKTMEEDDE